MTLLHPWFLLLALLVPLGAWLGRRAPAVLFAPGRFLRDLPRSWRGRLLPLPRVLQVAGLLLAVFALARPVERIPLPLTAEGIDIMLCLDTSSSMKANDLDPQRTRLDVAKAAAARFVAGRSDDRIGVMSFARYPDVACPPTLDHDAVRQFLAAVTLVRGDGPEDATGIGTAVARAAQVLQGGVAKSKVVILLTDGEENVATARTPGEIAPLHAGQLCEQLGVRVYAIAAGLAEGEGDWVLRTGGKFFAARDAGALAEVYGEIDALEKAALPEPRFRVEEKFLRFLVAALLLLLSGRLLQTAVLP